MMSSVEATKPAVSIFAPGPNTMPFGLMRNTRPLEDSWPRISDGLRPTTRFSTALWADGWMKRVASSAPIENSRQLMMVPSLLRISSWPAAFVPIVAWPWTTSAPFGFA